MDFSFAPKPHDVSFLTLRSKLEISGQLEDPQVGIDAGSLLANMPPIDLGTDEVVPCDRLIEQARTEPEESLTSSGRPDSLPRRLQIHSAMRSCLILIWAASR
jgi:hypothetical protein